MANNTTKNLLDIFNIFALGNSTDGLPTPINKTQLRSVLREMDSEAFESLFVKMMNELNLTFTCGYCEGSFRDVVQAYNKIHGYVSLLVSTRTQYFIIFCFILTAFLN